MTIKDIAELAGVSVSTVSKIMNHKDSHINENTRQRVLSIIKEYHYEPYASVKNKVNTFTLGIVIPESPDPASEQEFAALLSGITKEAQCHGYAVIPLRSKLSKESEKKCISQLISQNVCGILWQPSSFSKDDSAFSFQIMQQHREMILRDLERASIPCIILSDSSRPDAVCPEYETLGYTAAQKLLEHHHTEIVCVLHDDSDRSQKTAAGFLRAMTEHSLPAAEQNFHKASEIMENPSDHLENCTAILCTHQADAVSIFGFLARNHYIIPRDFSLVTILDYPPESLSYPALSGVLLGSEHFGTHLSRALIRMHETGSRQLCKEDFIRSASFVRGQTLDVPPSYQTKSILCVGPINYDCTIISDRLPQSGMSLMAFSSSYSIGGKGANQAIGAARLGQKVILIGKIGDDANAIRIIDELNDNGVLTHAVSRETNCESGKAYIQLDTNGESTITIVPEANQCLTPEYVQSMESVFSNASYCMISGEIPCNTVTETCTLCSSHNVKTVFKPAAFRVLPDFLYPLIDYFILNSFEAATLSKIYDNTALQADYFLKKGVGCVIITLGADGCYVKNDLLEKSYPPCRIFPVVDSTGAADAFISAFTCCLSVNRTLEDSIQVAQIAAAFIVSKVGCAPSMIDKKTLDNYITKELTEIRTF